jgi:hypothetical protein
MVGTPNTNHTHSTLWDMVTTVLFQKQPICTSREQKRSLYLGPLDCQRVRAHHELGLSLRIPVSPQPPPISAPNEVKSQLEQYSSFTVGTSSWLAKPLGISSAWLEGHTTVWSLTDTEKITMAYDPPHKTPLDLQLPFILWLSPPMITS